MVTFFVYGRGFGSWKGSCVQGSKCSQFDLRLAFCASTFHAICKNHVHFTASVTKIVHKKSTDFFFEMQVSTYGANSLGGFKMMHVSFQSHTCDKMHGGLWERVFVFRGKSMNISIFEK